MAEKYDMKLLYCKTFEEIFNDYSDKEENLSLLYRMKALEVDLCYL